MLSRRNGDGNFACWLHAVRKADSALPEEDEWDREWAGRMRAMKQAIHSLGSRLESEVHELRHEVKLGQAGLTSEMHELKAMIMAALEQRDLLA